MGKALKKPSNHPVKVKQKNTQAFLKRHVRVAGSLQTSAVQQNMPQIITPTPPAPHIAQIAALNEKLVLAHKSLEGRLRLCEATINENTSLKAELQRLKDTLNQANATPKGDRWGEDSSFP